MGFPANIHRDAKISRQKLAARAENGREARAF
jgi:hypothetical protein